MNKAELKAEIERLTEAAKRARRRGEHCDSGKARQEELAYAIRLEKQAQQLQQQLNEMGNSSCTSH